MPSATPMSADRVPVRQKSAGSRIRDSILYSPAWMVVVGLAVREACIAAGHLYHLDIMRWTAFEMANIGRSLAVGHGFSTPFYNGPGTPWNEFSGPTAWTAPLYPWLVSLVFRIVGVYSDAAGFVLLTINSIFSALTSWTIYRIGRRVFDVNVGALSGWIWALSPFAVYWSATWIWETTLSAFLLSLILMVTVEMEGSDRIWVWVRYGLLWGLIALTNTSILAWLPFSGCWLAYRLHRAGKRFLAPVVISGLVFWATITPWLVRNYVVFDKVIFIRGDLGSELRAGNNSLAQGTWVPTYRAGNNPALFAQYKRMGEVAYDAEQARLAKQWITENPERFRALIGRKLLYFWYGLPETPLPRLGHFLFFALTVTSLGGLLLAFVRRLPGVFLFATLMIFYPLVYYITFPTMRYRHPIEPALVILAGLLLASMAEFVNYRMTRSAVRRGV